MTRRRLTSLLCTLTSALTLALGAGDTPAAASEQRPTVDEVSRQVMCPTCGAPLSQSDSPAADRMRAYIRARIDDGWTRTQIIDGLVDEYGSEETVLAAPRKQGGVGLLAWGLPLALLALGLVAGAVSVLRWRRAADAGQGVSSPPGASSSSGAGDSSST